MDPEDVERDFREKMALVAAEIAAGEAHIQYIEKEQRRTYCYIVLSLISIGVSLAANLWGPWPVPKVLATGLGVWVLVRAVRQRYRWYRYERFGSQPSG